LKRVDVPEVVTPRLLMLQINSEQWFQQEILHVFEPRRLLNRKYGISNAKAESEETV
jgi:hypothetical protein